MAFIKYIFFSYKSVGPEKYKYPYKISKLYETLLQYTLLFSFKDKERIYILYFKAVEKSKYPLVKRKNAKE